MPPRRRNVGLGLDRPAYRAVGENFVPAIVNTTGDDRAVVDAEGPAGTLFVFAAWAHVQNPEPLLGKRRQLTVRSRLKGIAPLPPPPLSK